MPQRDHEPPAPVGRGARASSDYDELWVCAICGERFVVPSLARCCETQHSE